MVPLDPAELLSADSETITPLDLVTPQTAAITVPHAAHLYDDLLFGHRFVAQTQLEIDGAKFSVKAEKSLDVVPAVEITNVTPNPCVRTEATLGRCESFHVTLTNHLAKPFAGAVGLITHSGQHGSHGNFPVALAPLETRVGTFSNADARPDRETLSELLQPATVLVSISSADQGRQALAETHLISKRLVTVTYADARVAKDLRVGYVPSFDQTLKQSLDALGVPSAHELKLSMRSKGLTLAGYKTIILDNRAYYAHPELIAANSKLMKYVEEGGTLDRVLPQRQRVESE